jgi:hypothetical protein
MSGRLPVRWASALSSQVKFLLDDRSQALYFLRKLWQRLPSLGDQPDRNLSSERSDAILQPRSIQTYFENTPLGFIPHNFSSSQAKIRVSYLWPSWIRGADKFLCGSTKIGVASIWNPKLLGANLGGAGKLMQIQIPQGALPQDWLGNSAFAVSSLEKCEVLLKISWFLLFLVSRPSEWEVNSGRYSTRKRPETNARDNF